MPKFEIEIDDKGEFVGQVPAEFDAVLTKIKTTSHGEGYGKGVSKAAEDAKAQIASTIAAEKARLEALQPLEREKWNGIDELNKTLKAQLETTLSESRKQMTSAAEQHAVELTRKTEAVTKRNDRIKSLVTANLRSLAASAGAREETLPVLESYLLQHIGYNDDMEPYVLGADGEPAKTTAGSALPIDVFVKQFIDNQPAFRKPAPGRGGDARGGARLNGHMPSGEGSKARLEGGDRSLESISDHFGASLAKRRSA